MGVNGNSIQKKSLRVGIRQCLVFTTVRSAGQKGQGQRLNMQQFGLKTRAVIGDVDQSGYICGALISPNHFTKCVCHCRSLNLAWIKKCWKRKF